MKRFGKSLWKGVKYAGLSLGAGALVGAGDVVPSIVLDTLLKAGVPEAFAAIASAYGTPALGAVVAVALEQVRKHRDEIFAEPEE